PVTAEMQGRKETRAIRGLREMMEHQENQGLAVNQATPAILVRKAHRETPDSAVLVGPPERLATQATPDRRAPLDTAGSRGPESRAIQDFRATPAILVRKAHRETPDSAVLVGPPERLATQATPDR